MTQTLQWIALTALLIFSAASQGQTLEQETYDLTYTGDLMGLLPKLHEIDPSMTMSHIGTVRDVPLSLSFTGVGKLDILRTIGKQAGDKADLTYFSRTNTLKIHYKAPPQPVITPEPVKRYPDGSVVVKFGQARPVLVCQALDPCAIELEAGERIYRLDVGDPNRWEVSPALVGEGDRRAIVLVVRPTALKLKTRLLLATNKRIYSITLASAAKPTDPTDSRLLFVYPPKGEPKIAL